MQREVIRPNFERPVIVQLDHDAEGAIQREGQFGVDYEYRVNSDGGIMWLPRQAQEQIRAMRLTKGDEIALQKIKRGRNTEWLIERVEEEPTPAQAQPAAAKQNHWEDEQHAMPAKPAAAEIRGQAATRQEERKEARYIMPPKVAELAGCLVAAAKAVHIAQQEATAAGLTLRFNESQIQALACTLFIQAEKAVR